MNIKEILISYFALFVTIGSFVTIFLLLFCIPVINQKICKWQGHKFVLKKAKVMMNGGMTGDVCTTYKCKIPTCKRIECRKTLPPVELEYKMGYTSVSMSERNWDILEEKGYLIEE